MKFLFGILLLFSVTESCKSKSLEANDINPKSTQEVLTGTYTFSQIDDGVISTKNPTLTFSPESNSITGFSGCNRFFAKYEISGSEISFDKIGTTKMLCDDVANSTENNFLNALEKADAFKINGSQLILTQNNKTLLTANKSEPIEQTASLKETEKSKAIGDHYNSKSVIYKAFSRGFSLYVSVSEKTIATTNDRSFQNQQTKSCPEEDWNAIETLMANLETDALRNLKAPSNKYTFDGAAHATLSIQQGDVVITTPTFDHGNPPEEIQKLVNKVLSLGESIKKQ